MESSFDFESESSYHKPAVSRRTLVLGAVVIGVVAVGLGVLIGYFSHTEDCDPPDGPCLGSSVPNKIIQEADDTIFDKLYSEINKENIRENLRKWTEYSHLAGTEGENRLARELYDTWVEQGLDHVTTRTYDILLSYPNETDPSFIYILDDAGNVTYRSQERELPLEDSQNKSDVVLPYNSYSFKGDAEGDLVYVNYARIEDFRLLQNNYSIDLTGKIVIARYGQIFRGTKVSLAESFGAAGVLLYTDPLDYSVPDEPPYPDSWWLPPTGVQRGTVYNGDGDPLTPGYPSTATAYRYSPENVTLPKIPVHPIGFGDAEKFLEQLLGEEAPAEWQGGLNLTYKIGPGYGAGNGNVRMHVTTYNERANSTNVFGVIEGEIEPDRYVLLGNHRDAWVVGAVDPTSGTAVMMEISRVLSNLVKDGWRPRRTIAFASWGAEEFALIGSYEWVEQYVKILGERTVAYLNVDLAFAGNDSMRALGVPLLYDVLYHVAGKINTPNSPGMTMYEEWLSNFPDSNPDGSPTGRPSVGSLGSGSDYASFIAFAGIPCLDVRYQYGSQYRVSSYPLYHSAYETFNLVSKYIDPHFEYSQAIGRFWLETARYLADSYVLPLNVSAYPSALSVFIQDLEAGYGDIMNDNAIFLDDLKEANEKFKQGCSTFQTRLENVNKNNPVEVRRYNDQIMALERAFLDPAGLPLRPLYKHLVFAPSTYDAYAGATFPGLVDLMYEIDLSEDPEQRWEEVRKHLATIVFAIESATSVLEPPDLFQ